MTEVSSLCVRVRFCCVLVVCHLHPVPSLSFLLLLLLLLLYRNIFSDPGFSTSSSTALVG